MPRSVLTLVAASMAVICTLQPARSQDDPPAVDNSRTPDVVTRVVRSYDIRFLTEPLPQYEVDVWPVADSPRLDERSPGETPDLAVGPPVLHETAAVGFDAGEYDEDVALPAGLELTTDTIAGLIRQNIDEDSWANTRNRIEIDPTTLVVTQTPEVHGRIAQLLGALSLRRARMVTVDVGLVPVAALGAVAERETPWLADEEFDAVLERAGGEGRRFTVTAYNEQRVAVFNGQLRAAALDSEINQTGVVPVQNLVVRKLPIGAALEVRPTLIEGTEWLRLDLSLGRLTPAGDMEKRRGLFLELEVVPLADAALFTTTLMRSGQGVVAGHFTGRDGDTVARDFAVIARARRLDPGMPERGPAAPGTEEFPLRIYDVSLLSPELRDGEGVEGSPLLVDLLRRNVEPAAWRDERTRIVVDGGRLLLVAAPPDVHTAVRAWLDSRLAARCRVATLDIRVLEGPIDAALRLTRDTAENAELPPGWRGTEAARQLATLFRGRATALLGETLRAHGARVRTYLRRLELVSGGTGFTVIRMPDPVVGSAGDGFILEARARTDSREGRLAMELQFGRYRTDFGRQAAIFAPIDLEPAVTMDVENASEEVLEAARRRTREIPVRYAFDQPRQARLEAWHSIVLEVGRDALLEVSQQPGGRARVTVVSVLATATIEGED